MPPSRSAPSTIILAHLVPDNIHVRRASALVISALVQLAIIWALLNRVSNDEAIIGRGAGRTPSVFSLSPMTEAATSSDASGRFEPELQPSTLTELDRSEPANLPEWSTTQIPKGASDEAVGEAINSSTSVQTRGGVGSFDPYAGAAPMRLDSNARQWGIARSGNNRQYQINEATIRAIRNQVAARWPQARGFARLHAAVSADGTILDVWYSQGNLDREVWATLKKELIGVAVISAGSAPSTVVLPEIRFG